MADKTIENEIIDALNEAIIMESANTVFSREHVLEVAQRLSLCPFSFVELVAQKHLNW